MTYPQQGYPPQGVPQPQYPQQPYAPTGYPPQQFPQQGYSPQGYAPPQQFQQPQQAQPQLAPGSLDAFFSQPSVGGGAALSFDAPNNGQPGTTHVFVVSRPVTDADIQQQTNPQNGQPATYKDGRPKYVMKVPARVRQSDKHPEGTAQWYCAGAARDELTRAMAAVGAPSGPPEAGAVIVVQCTGTRPSGPGMNPSKVYQVQYLRPGPQAAQFAAQSGINIADLAPYNGQAPAAAPAEVPAPVAQQAPAPAQAPPPQQAPAPQQVPQAQAAPVPPAPAGPEGMSPDQLALLAKLAGQVPAS